jgi:hypothetical protein
LIASFPTQCLRMLESGSACIGARTGPQP